MRPQIRSSIQSIQQISDASFNLLAAMILTEVYNIITMSLYENYEANFYTALRAAQKNMAKKEHSMIERDEIDEALSEAAQEVIFK